MLRLSSLLFASVPVLALAGCGDNIDPDTGTEGALQGGENEATLLQEVPERPLSGFIDFAHPDCDRASLGYEAVIRYADDQSPVANIECELHFSDGGESFDCAGVHELASAGVYGVTLRVTDLDTGATFYTEDESVVYPALTVDLAAQAPACGLELSWSSTFSASSEVHTTISPGDLVVGGGLQIGGSGSAQVTAPGTYTITVEVEDERTTGPICLASASKTVEVVACPDDHHHTPDCEH